MRESEVQIGNSGSCATSARPSRIWGAGWVARGLDQGLGHKMECIEFTSAQLNLSLNARRAERTISAIHLRPEGHKRRSFLKAPREALH
jgi:hypothetical protein